MWGFLNPMKTFFQEENVLLFIHSDYRVAGAREKRP